MRFILSLIVFTSMAASGLMAASGEIVLTNKGNWSASFYAANNDGVPMCNVSTSWPSMSASMHVKYVGKTIFVQLFKQGWDMADNTEARVKVNFGDSSSYNAKAYALTNKQGMKFLQFRISDVDEETFLSEFSKSSKTVVTFPDGDEPNWIAGMKGSREAAAAFQRCAAVVDARQSTQPTGKSTQPTQPVTPKAPVNPVSVKPSGEKI